MMVLIIRDTDSQHMKIDNYALWSMTIFEYTITFYYLNDDFHSCEMWTIAINAIIPKHNVMCFVS